MNTHEVYDRYGKRIENHDGILKDGQFIRARMNLMDAANSTIAAGAALMDAVKRNEVFDARGHQPGCLTTRDAATTANIHQALDDRDARLTNAWKQPPAVVAADTTIKPADKDRTIDPSAGTPALLTARDRILAERDRRVEDAWKNF